MQEGQNKGVTPGNSSFLSTEELLQRSRPKDFSVFSPQVGGDPGPAHRADRRPVFERLPETLASPSEQLGLRIAAGLSQEKPGVNPQSPALESVQRIERSLILKNLPLHVDKLEIWQALTEFGAVEQISKLRRSNPQSMFCYVTMQDVRDALMLQESGYFIFRGKRRVHVEKFVSKLERGLNTTRPAATMTEARLSGAVTKPSQTHNQLAPFLENQHYSEQLYYPGAQCSPGHNAKTGVYYSNLLVDKGDQNTGDQFKVMENTITLRKGLTIMLSPSLRNEQSIFNMFGKFSSMGTQSRHEKSQTSIYHSLDPAGNLRFNIQPVGVRTETPELSA